MGIVKVEFRGVVIQFRKEEPGIRDESSAGWKVKGDTDTNSK
jgi:hypothetical protein